MGKEVQQLVFTNENCIGCNRCISVCSALGACISKVENGKATIEVDGNRCVVCGACIDACEHNARVYVDDTERFFADLKRGEKISILLAPAFKANYPEEYESVLGGLKSLGVNRIISISFGADICTWGYLNYIQKYHFIGGISQPCPAVVSYIEHYLPELLPKLFPVQSPLMCGAIYCRKELGITDKLAFISPCIAKKLEIDDPNNGGIVQYNVTFEHMMKYVREHHISGPSVSDEIEYGLGSIYPTPGGLKENVYWFLGEDVAVRQIEGEKRMYEWLEANKGRIKEQKTPFTFIDALNCENGCLCGTGTESSINRTDDALYALMEIKKNSKKDSKRTAWGRPLTPAKRLKKLNEQFKDLRLEDYLRSYTDRSSICQIKEPSPQDEERIYLELHKTTPESRMINCSCCGYASCKDMVKAIYNGFNRKENCIHYEKDEILLLGDAKELAANLEREKGVIQEQKEAILDTITTVDEHFGALYESIEHMNNGNESNAEESTNIAHEIMEVSNFMESLQQSMQKIESLLVNLGEDNEHVVDIAEETNLLSLNASIEAARAGDMGRSFAVVATQISQLAANSQKTAEQSSNNQQQIGAAVDQILKETKHLDEIIRAVNERTQNLAASTEQISSSASVVMESADSIRESLDQLSKHID
ncbi:MAG: transcriptional regulator [Lachnospiraceae bacterium]|nr:transcriptional regulator [Lachnospiraceae bacterium]